MISLAVAAVIATSPVPVLDVIQIYGRLAGPECFGKTVPVASGASCQLTAEQLRATLGDVDEAACGVLPLTWRVDGVASRRRRDSRFANAGVLRGAARYTAVSLAVEAVWHRGFALQREDRGH